MTCFPSRSWRIMWHIVVWRNFTSSLTCCSLRLQRIPPLVGIWYRKYQSCTFGVLANVTIVWHTWVVFILGFWQSQGIDGRSKNLLCLCTAFHSLSKVFGCCELYLHSQNLRTCLFGARRTKESVLYPQCFNNVRSSFRGLLAYINFSFMSSRMLYSAAAF